MSSAGRPALKGKDRVPEAGPIEVRSGRLPSRSSRGGWVGASTRQRARMRCGGARPPNNRRGHRSSGTWRCRRRRLRACRRRAARSSAGMQRRQLLLLRRVWASSKTGNRRAASSKALDLALTGRQDLELLDVVRRIRGRPPRMRRRVAVGRARRAVRSRALFGQPKRRRLKEAARF